ncbi:hypothetical protein NA56DRAFT_745253 [Hyaloscypha hepaticicola]|uniref:Ferric reductase NAD binding domain-containing protein n=1 Tax=Hyaloscypha hepaticicola TaxID=2082293 RepID=A0A2J6QGU3_9HELO|nr:hypothetical protein NA56DRAFT_745253 [Hyaloscypha hepaticicola]
MLKKDEGIGDGNMGRDENENFCHNGLCGSNGHVKLGLGHARHEDADNWVSAFQYNKRIRCTLDSWHRLDERYIPSGRATLIDLPGGVTKIVSQRCLAAGRFTGTPTSISIFENRALALINGPCAGEQLDFAWYSSVLFIAGSTGVTFTFPILLDLAFRVQKQNLPVRKVTFIWAIKPKILQPREETETQPFSKEAVDEKSKDQHTSH